MNANGTIVYVVHHLPHVGDTHMHGVFGTIGKAWDAIEKLSERFEIVSRALPDSNGIGTIWIRSLSGGLGMLTVEPVEMDKLYLS